MGTETKQNKTNSGTRGVCSYRRRIKEELWNNGMQEKCTVYMKPTSAAEDYIRGKLRRGYGQQGSCSRMGYPWRYVISDLKYFLRR